MLIDLANLSMEQTHTYRLQLRGALNSPTIDWCGEVFVIPQGRSGILMVSLIVDPVDLCNLLDQFSNLNLTLLPIENESQESDPPYTKLVVSSPWITNGTPLPEQAQIDFKEV